MKTFRAVTLLTLFTLMASGALATMVLPSSLEQMTGRSDAVVTGRVTESFSYKESGRIYTKYMLEVSDPVKFPGVELPTTVEFRVMGGEVDGMRLEVDMAPTFEPGEEVLLFLVGQKSEYTVFGIYYGACRIFMDESGQKQVGGPLFNARQTVDLDTREVQLNALPIENEPLQQFTDRIRRIQGEQ